MLSLDPLVDNTESTLEDIYRKIVRESEEVRIATGYFYLSGFDLVKEDLELLENSDQFAHAPMRILMGNETDRRTADEIDEGLNLRDQVQQVLQDDIDDLNNAQLGRLDRLRDFIAQGLVDVRVRVPEEGRFHAKGASFRAPPDNEEERDAKTDKRPGAVVVGSSNFSRSGHRNNIELNLTSQDRYAIESFEDWFDNQWANAEEFSEEILEVIETHPKYQQWQEEQVEEDDELGTFVEPFELYKLLAYDALDGNVSERLDSPLYYFQSIGYESARAKLAQYNGCIISDSVGLGKSFIGGELLRDYRYQNERCLLIVPANLTDQWRDLLQDATDDDGNPFFNLEVDGEHLDVLSISKFQNLSYDTVEELREQYDVVLIDEAHRFRNFGKWRPNPSDDDDYKGTRRHANLRLLRGLTMIMLTATPINNSAQDLRNLIGLFSDVNELRNKASLDFEAFDRYIDLAERRKRIAAGKDDVSETEREELVERLQRQSEEISQILNEVMVLRTRKHVKDQITEQDDIEMSFSPPTVNTEEYTLPPAYRPIYDSLPDVMDALHLPHITIRNPQAGSTLKALYKLNLLKRLESSTYAFVQSIHTLYQSETDLLSVLERLPEERDVRSLRLDSDSEEGGTLDDYVEGKEAAEDLEQTLEEFGFDTGAVRADDGSQSDELAQATVQEVITYIHEDLALLAYFLSMFIGDVAQSSDDVRDQSVVTRQWLSEHNANRIPDIPEDQTNPLAYPHCDLSEVVSATRDFYDAVFSLREFRDPKIDRLVDVLGQYDQKVLVFTQYRGTADYLHRTLVGHTDSPLTEANSAVVKGGDDNKRSIIRRFAPEASGYQQTLQESEETELQYVIATDTLSEGVNLQDISVVINYDLPWNPMRIVQRVGRIDRIGSTAEKYVHNFFPDGDIEAAIKLLKRLQAKISDIALIVGKENNILDPNENEILEKAGIETEKTIGELELDEIKNSLQRTRTVRDYNDLDDTSVNSLFRNTGSDESAAFERLLLKKQLNEEYEQTSEDFEFAEDYFDQAPAERDQLYTRVDEAEGRPRPGAFGLAHMWFEDSTDAPLGRTRSDVYYAPRGGDPESLRKIRSLNITPDTTGVPFGDDVLHTVEGRDALKDLVDERLQTAREGQIEGAFQQGESYSVEQEKLLSYLQHLQANAEGYLSESDAHCTTVSERATQLRERLKAVKLANTDEDTILRATFRDDDRTLGQWDVEEFFDVLETFLDENIAGSTEYQSSLAKASEVHARLLCWGLIG